MATKPNAAQAGAGPPTYWDSVKAAFHAKVRLKGLGNFPLNKIVLAGLLILGAAPPLHGLWLFAAGLETAYLTALAGNRRFRKVLAAQRSEVQAEVWSERVAVALARLDPASRNRYERLHERCSEILGISETLEGPGAGRLEDLKGSGLSQLLWIFLRLLSSRSIAEQNLRSSDVSVVEREIADLQAQIEAGGMSGDLLKSKQGTLEILEKRRQNLAQAREALSVIDSELNRIEHQVQLLREEAGVARSPQILSSRIDSVTTTLGETSQWMSQNAAALGLLAEEPEGAPPLLPDPGKRERQAS